MILEVVSRTAAAVGRGLAAGFVGTVFMTVSSTLEMRLRDRASSTAAADAAGTVLGVEPKDEAEQRFSTMVHFGYGTALGGLRGLLASLGLRGPTATAVHLVVVWGGEQVMLPKLGAAPPATQWGAQELAIDGMHHLVYATATGIVFDLLQENA